MLNMNEDIKIYLRLEPTDMRKSIDTLSILVVEVLELNPSSGHLFIFRNRQADKLKILYYEQNCFNLWYRRLEKGKFVFPKDKNGHIEMSMEHFKWLLASDKFTQLEAQIKQNIQDYF